jgi:hypothetical protein
MAENGELRQFNPAADIAREVTLDVITRHRDALKQTREGKMTNEEILTEDQRKLNKVRGLFLTISAQRDMINISMPVIWFECDKKWRKKNTTDEEKEKNPFENEYNDYNSILEVKEVLKLFERDLINADETETQEDDYLIKRHTQEGTVYKLTTKYFDLIDALEDTYKDIYFLMIKHRIVSAGIEEDEELTYKELEKLAIEKVQEA